MKTTRKLLFTLLILVGFGQAETNYKALEHNFKDPPMDCWPHTRWWWPGNPVSKEEITWELEQMRSVGIRGVEQITMGPVYEKVDIEYMSDEFLEMISHTIKEAKRLGMEVSLNFGGPGWIIGGPWVPELDRSKDMVPTSVDLVGPKMYSGPLPDSLTKTQRSWEIYYPRLKGDEKLIAVIAGQVIDGRLVKNTFRDLTSTVRNRSIQWQVPDGRWKLMAFWLARNGHDNAVDHFNKGAMERYCNWLGNKFKQAAGEEFGKTLESLFCDSFELPNLASGIYWSDGLMEEFQQFKGYDLTEYLPAIWWKVDDISPKIRYDVNHFLHHMGLTAFFDTFLDWCEQNGIKGRIQTYGFTTDNIEAAGRTHIPEMEITPGEKDAAPWFDTRIGPKKYVASGAHLYGRPVVSVEAYTFMHWERYRATLEELKIATDGFLRTGATKFYNHGFSFLPERDLVPTRRMPWAPQVNPSNVWWRYYPLLTQYIARCSYLLRQGHFAPDIAVYSPLANQWTLDVLNPRKWTREFDWGELGFLLVSNGYDFDLLNDDALQNLAAFEEGKIKIRDMEYKVLLLPNSRALPLETMRAIEEYVRGGGHVIAFDDVPESSTGLDDYRTKDKEVRRLVADMFDEPFGRDAVGTVKYGRGRTYWIKHVIDRRIWWDQRSSTLDPFLNTIRKIVPPDFGIDFAFEGVRKNEGLTFLRRRLDGADIYFVTNIQDRSVEQKITFRVKAGSVQEWNPYDGTTGPFYEFRSTAVGTELPVRLSPWQSTIFVFLPEKQGVHVTDTNMMRILKAGQEKISGLVNANGDYYVQLATGGQDKMLRESVADLPAPFNISGTWKFSLSGKDFAGLEETLDRLGSWTDNPWTRHVSGTGRYEIEFDLPQQNVRTDQKIELDLGKVGNIAEVELNDRKAGIVWIKGQRLDVTDLLQPGKNSLVVIVTNTNINRVSGMNEPVPVPEELVPRFGSGHLKTSVPEFGFEPLPPSGLMGPVKLIPLRILNFPVR